MDTSAHDLMIPTPVVVGSLLFVLWTIVTVVRYVRNAPTRSDIEREQHDTYARFHEQRDALLAGLAIPAGHYGIVCCRAEEDDGMVMGRRVVPSFREVASELLRCDDPAVEIAVADGNGDLILGGPARPGPKLFSLTAIASRT